MFIFKNDFCIVIIGNASCIFKLFYQFFFVLSSSQCTIGGISQRQLIVS